MESRSPIQHRIAKLTPMTDRLQAARGGDDVALGALIESHRDRLEEFVRSRVRAHYRSQIDLRDLVNEVVAIAVRSIATCRAQDEDAFFGWLVGIAKNVVLREIERLERRQTLQILDPPDSGTPSPSKDLRRVERFDRLRSALEGLSAEHREVILLVRIEGLPIREVADRMNRSEAAARKLLWRALKELRKQFGETESISLPQRSLLAELDRPDA